MTDQQLELLRWLFPPETRPQWWVAMWPGSEIMVWTGPNPWATDQDEADVAASAVLLPWLRLNGLRRIKFAPPNSPHHPDNNVICVVWTDGKLALFFGRTIAAALIAACASSRAQRHTRFTCVSRA